MRSIPGNKIFPGIIDRTYHSQRRKSFITLITSLEMVAVTHQHWIKDAVLERSATTTSSAAIRGQVKWQLSTIHLSEQKGFVELRRIIKTSNVWYDRILKIIINIFQHKNI